jgi:poly-gamma-glutamate synthesis protein (capsule biosynthesis protein)
MIPTQIKRFRVNHASKQDGEFLKKILSREGKELGTNANVDSKGILLSWNYVDASIF